MKKPRKETGKRTLAPMKPTGKSGTTPNEQWRHRRKTKSDMGHMPVKIAPTTRVNATQYIAIIGGGPKGMYGLERLVAQLNAHPVSTPIEIHVFNRIDHFGSGEIYNPEQPDYLLINYAIGNINMWIDEEPPAVVPNPLPLTKWLQTKHDPPLPVDDLSYVSRAAVGRYLEAGFQAIIANAPDNVTIHCVVGDVADVMPMGNDYAVSLRSTDGTLRRLPVRYGHLLFATGHPRNQLDKRSANSQRFASQYDHLHFVPFIYPVEPTLQVVPANAQIAMKGLGLTFIDGVLALTEGRGGHFTRAKSGELRYRPGGEEPATIYPFSRSGAPMIPRGPACGESPTVPHFFTDEAVAKLMQRATTTKRNISFEDDIWPLVTTEMSYAYYRVAFSTVGETLTDDQLKSAETLADAIAAFHQRHPEIQRFALMTLLDPLAGQAFDRPNAQHKFVVETMRFWIAEAKLGEQGSPWMAAAAVWRVATARFGELLEFGGLGPQGHATFIREYASTLNRISFGPPIESMEKMVALAEAGILRFDCARAAEIQIDQAQKQFLLQSPAPAKEQPITCLIDARISKVSLLDDRSPLYHGLLQRGLVRLFKNSGQQRDETPYYPGSLELTPEGGFVVSATGRVNHALAITGTPTEGITYDNDSLSRKRNNFVSAWAAHVRASCAREVLPTREVSPQ